MKLTVEKGELALPADFSFEVEQNSAFFSDDGAATVPADIPATPEDRARLGFPSRIGRSSRFVNLFPAAISAGTIHKTGTLIIESASEDAITCSIALEDSEFYANFKEKNLKDIFSAKILTTYSTPGEWYNYLYSIYTAPPADSRFRLIPVAVDGRNEHSFQVNNEPDTSDIAGPDTYPLIHKARMVVEDDEDVSVPEGYGIAPFYLLHAFLDDLFTLCGYTVRKNCFRSDKLATLLLLHNCADVICNGRIDCSDLVPGKTVSELLSWLLAKFRAQIYCHPATKTVDILLLSDILSSPYDIDLSPDVIGAAVITFSRASRLVIRPNTSLPGAAPAAETVGALVRKYGALATGEVNIGLGLIKATGTFEEVGAPLSEDGGKRYKILGTNIFTFDQEDTQDSEQIDWDDPTPPMVRVGGMLMPYIGKRIHRNSSLNGSGKDEDQEIIIVDYAGRSRAAVILGGQWAHGYYSGMISVEGRYFYGTTQAFDNLGDERPGRFSLTPEGMFDLFFSAYNKILRNNAVNVSLNLDISPAVLQNFNLYALKLFDGQKLLPRSLRYEVGARTRCTGAEFLLVKDYTDALPDSITEIPKQKYDWQIDESEALDAVARVQAENAAYKITFKYNDAYSSGDKTVFMAAPKSTGETSAPIARTIDIGYWFERPTSRPGITEKVFSVLSSETVNIRFRSILLSSV